MTKYLFIIIYALMLNFYRFFKSLQIKIKPILDKKIEYLNILDYIRYI